MIITGGDGIGGIGRKPGQKRIAPDIDLTADAQGRDISQAAEVVHAGRAHPGQDRRLADVQQQVVRDL